MVSSEARQHTVAVDSNPEQQRLAQAHENTQPWYRWGPYLSERQWGTVREDYSPYGNAWDSFPHDHARSRIYRWGEDGLLGISDEEGRLCFALALWNEADPILKERLFGLTGSEGNHGEDVKEYYYFLDNTPTHSYMKALYKYPQRAFPYADLVAENRHRGRGQPEYELIDSGVFAENRYFDVTIEYAKVDPQDILIRISATNRGPDAAPLHVLPTLWFRNSWAWGNGEARPELRATGTAAFNGGKEEQRAVQASDAVLGEYWLAYEQAPELLFTENESNPQRLWGVPNQMPFVKDGINDTIVNGATGTVNPDGVGTKAAVHYHMHIVPGATETVLLRLSSTPQRAPFMDAGEIFKARQAEADRFYTDFGAANLSEDARCVQRQAFAGLLWSKQFYYYDVEQWLHGDPAGPPPPDPHKVGRNHEWRHLNNADVISMPDTWEYPLVCSMGPEFPLHTVGAHRRRIRQEAIDPAVARVVYASQWAVARLRMGIRGCEPACARLGCLARRIVSRNFCLYHRLTCHPLQETMVPSSRSELAFSPVSESSEHHVRCNKRSRC